MLGLVSIGLGHLYAGRLAAGLALWATSVVLGLAAVGALRAGSVAAAATVVFTSLAFRIGQAVHAARTARRTAAEPRAAFSRPLALAGFLAASLVLGEIAASAAREWIVQTVYIPSGSMIPTVQVGDYLAVAPGRPSALRGAVVIHEPPPGNPRREQILRRVVAVGGDTVEIRDGALWVNDAPVAREHVPGPCTYREKPETSGAWREEPCVDFVETLDGRTFHTHCTPYIPCGDVARTVVPAGFVWTAGDHRDHSADSRVFGPLPESAIVGEVRWVLLSWGPDGVRWDRTGRAVR